MHIGICFFIEQLINLLILRNSQTKLMLSIGVSKLLLKVLSGFILLIFVDFDTVKFLNHTQRT